jgi:hypothetical protein
MTSIAAEAARAHRAGCAPWSLKPCPWTTRASLIPSLTRVVARPPMARLAQDVFAKLGGSGSIPFPGRPWPGRCGQGLVRLWKKPIRGRSYLHSYGVCSRLMSAFGDVITQADHCLYDGAGSPGWERRRTRGRSVGNSCRCIERRRSGYRWRRRSQYGWSCDHCEPVGYDVPVQLLCRPCRSLRPIRHGDRQPRSRTCHAGPRPPLLYA